MTIYSSIGLCAAIFVLAASPGPGVLATVSRALSTGFRSALALIAGIVVGDIVFLMLAVFGLSMAARAMGELFLIVKVFGGAYLIWLGIRMWFNAPTLATVDQRPHGRSHLENLAAGLLITLSNPKVILFYCGFLPTFLDLSALSYPDLIVVVCIIAAVLGGVLAAYAYLAGRAVYLVTGKNAARRLHRAAGGVMVAAGVAIAAKT